MTVTANVSSVEAGKTYVLYEVLDTRYITKILTHPLKDFLELCKKEFEATGKQVIVDIKNSKFNPDNHSKIIDYCDYVHFIDSDNPVIDSILDHNARVSKVRRMEKEKQIMIETIPTEFDVVRMYEYVRNLDRSKVYRLCSFGELNGKIADVSVLIAMSINYLYPEVFIDLSEQAREYFRIFRKFWMYTGLVKRESYNLLWQNSNILRVDAIRIDENGDNIFYIPGVGEITEEILNQNFLVMPFEFGSTKLDTDPELSDIFDNISNELQRLMKKKKKKKLTSELVTIERS